MKFIKRRYKTYLLIIMALFALLSFPRSCSEKIRGASVAVLSPSWNAIGKKAYWLSKRKNSFTDEEVLALKLENNRLWKELERLQDLQKLESFFIDKVSELELLKKDEQELSTFFHHHFQELQKLLKLNLKAVPAKVVFRDPSFWNNSLWIDVGEEKNVSLPQKIIAKNSPVVLGNALVGVVDYVGQKQSRIRLISDPGLNPSVHVSRGGGQNRYLYQQVSDLLNALRTREDLHFSSAFNEELIESLEVIRKHLSENKENLFLAKGEMHGALEQTKRSSGLLLKGVGFNYDYPDKWGPARDLRTGKPLVDKENFMSVPLLKPNDLLVTTGMDGLFPEGLEVGEVTSIGPLKEGGYAYDLEAKPSAGDLGKLSTLFVLPPSGYDEDDQPLAY